MLKEQIIGVWSLVSYQSQDSAGYIEYPLGENATGFLMYHPEGYMSAQLMRQGRPAYASGDSHKGTKEEMAEAAYGYMAYAGKYEVNEDRNTLIHHMEVSMNPTWLGQQQPRIVSIEAGILRIRNGLNPNQKLIWKRVQ
ncbi:lipocalin-like domain-containing protein [Oceanobacillus sp. FSL K6-2867]|uniref:lipocalin-like domain-containing protein n=1 Tax=Oceanobacillus sp. FSL K6-2867 TaxID=2954748 RepID=UPI0030D8556B